MLLEFSLKIVCICSKISGVTPLHSKTDRCTVENEKADSFYKLTISVRISDPDKLFKTMSLITVRYSIVSIVENTWTRSIKMAYKFLACS